MCKIKMAYAASRSMLFPCALCENWSKTSRDIGGVLGHARRQPA